jgi:hypothetical protein
MGQGSHRHVHRFEERGRLNRCGGLGEKHERRYWVGGDSGVFLLLFLPAARNIAIDSGRRGVDVCRCSTRHRWLSQTQSLLSPQSDHRSDRAHGRRIRVRLPLNGVTPDGGRRCRTSLIGSPVPLRECV